MEMTASITSLFCRIVVFATSMFYIFILRMSFLRPLEYFFAENAWQLLLYLLIACSFDTISAFLTPKYKLEIVAVLIASCACTVFIILVSHKYIFLSANSIDEFDQGEKILWFILLESIHLAGMIISILVHFFDKRNSFMPRCAADVCLSLLLITMVSTARIANYKHIIWISEIGLSEDLLGLFWLRVGDAMAIFAAIFLSLKHKIVMLVPFAYYNFVLWITFLGNNSKFDFLSRKMVQNGFAILDIPNSIAGSALFLYVLVKILFSCIRTNRNG